MPATPAWLAPVENVLNRNIDAQARATLLMRRLEGKSLQLDVDGLTGTAAHVARDSPVRVQGDAEVAALYRELLALARPEPEEEAARLLGDVPARRLANLARRTLGWLQRSMRSLGANVAEYLTEEGRDLVNRTELDEFLRGVDELREGTDRLDARMRRLERRAGGSA
jgi:ubiquinone biosynthesis protein UbiJ